MHPEVINMYLAAMADFFSGGKVQALQNTPGGQSYTITKRMFQGIKHYVVEPLFGEGGVIKEYVIKPLDYAVESAYNAVVTPVSKTIADMWNGIWNSYTSNVPAIEYMPDNSDDPKKDPKKDPKEKPKTPNYKEAYDSMLNYGHVDTLRV
jgi:hypothetical protein